MTTDIVSNHVEMTRVDPASLHPMLPTALARAARTKEAVWDLETGGLDVVKCGIEGLVLCFGPTREDSFYMPIPEGADEALFEAMDPIGMDPDMLLIDHGGKYEDQYLIKHGRLRKWRCKRADTQIGTWLIKEDHPQYGLKPLAWTYFKVKLISWKEAKENANRLPWAQEKTFDEYGQDDGWATWRMWHEVVRPGLEKDKGLWKLFWELEMYIRHMLAEMQWAGVPIDTDFLKTQMPAIKSSLLAAENTFTEVAGRAVNLNSAQDIAVALFYEMRLPLDDVPLGAVAPALRHIFPEGVPSTAELALKELGFRGHRQVDAVLEYRGKKKDIEFYESLLDFAKRSWGYCYPSFSQTGTVSGRFSCSEPNLTQLPRPDKSNLRKAVAARAGQKWIAADFSQIELRILAHATRDPELLAAYNEGRDIHVETATACNCKRQEAKCVDPDTWIQLVAGGQHTTLRIGQLDSDYAHDSFTPMSLDVYAGAGYEAVKSLYKAGVKPTVVVKARHGIVRCSRQHRLELADGSLREAGEIGVGNVLAEASLDVTEGSDKDPACPEQAYLLGAQTRDARGHFQIPHWVMQGSWRTRKYYLSGLVDEKCEVHTRPWRGAADVMVLMGTLGLTSSLSVSGDGHTVSMGPDSRPNEVLEVAEGGDSLLYDLELHEDPHLYRVNGLSGHNSINFGFMYGMGGETLRWQLFKDSNIRISSDQAADYRRKYFERFSYVKAYHEAVDDHIRKHGYVREMFGHYRHLADLYAVREDRGKAHRMGVNFTIQGAAAALIKVAMRNIHRRLLSEGLTSQVQLRLQVHDELGFTADDDVVEYTCQLIKEEMSRCTTLRVPVLASVGSGDNWLVAK